MKKMLFAAVAASMLSISAFAADLPYQKSGLIYTPPPLPVFTWTGVYIGGQIGYQWGQSTNNQFFEVNDPAIIFPLASHNDQGIAGGGHLGYNWQISQFVLGVEGDVNGTGDRGTSTTILSGVFDESTRIGIEGSIRGRVGMALDRFLIYATGGGAFASIRNSFDCITCFTGNPIASANVGRFGWTAGAGIEYAVTNNWSIRTEYRYSDYGRITYSLAPITDGGFCCSASKQITNNLVTAGFSYRFDMFTPPEPVVAKY